MLQALYPWMHLIGRIMFSLIYLEAGVKHFTQMNVMAGYAGSRGAPAPKLTVPLTGVMSLAGALSLILGWHRFIGAGLLAIFMLWTSFIMHAFWKESDPMARLNERIHFLKDIAMGGAALFMAYYAGWPWPLSLGG